MPCWAHFGHVDAASSLRPKSPTIRAARFQPEGGSSWSAGSDVTDGDLPPAGGMCHVRSNGLLVEKKG